MYCKQYKSGNRGNTECYVVQFGLDSCVVCVCECATFMFSAFLYVVHTRGYVSNCLENV